jgi:hypothetical protein
MDWKAVAKKYRKAFRDRQREVGNLKRVADLAFALIQAIKRNRKACNLDQAGVRAPLLNTNWDEVECMNRIQYILSEELGRPIMF